MAGDTRAGIEEHVVAGMMLVSHQRYNEFIQQVQRDVTALYGEHRTRAVRSVAGDITRADFEVYWSGRWQCVAHEVPFKPEDERHCAIDPDLWQSIFASMGYSIAQGW